MREFKSGPPLFMLFFSSSQPNKIADRCVVTCALKPYAHGHPRFQIPTLRQQANHDTSFAWSLSLFRSQFHQEAPRYGRGDDTRSMLGQTVETNTYWDLSPGQVPPAWDQLMVSQTPHFSPLHSSNDSLCTSWLLCFHRAELPTSTARMPALQRSCDACVIAKRRCSLATPRCARCTTKKITCTYINQPAAATASRPRPCHGISRRPRPLPAPWSPLKSVFGSGPIPGARTDIPEVVRSFSPITLRQQMSILRSFVVHFAQYGAASFLHSCLYDSRLPDPLKQASRVCATYGLKERPFVSLKPKNIRSQVSQMLRSAARAGSFPDLVAHVQAIAFLQITCLLEGQEGCEEEAERDDRIFWELAQLLYIQAPVQLPRILSPWRAWLFAESVRRTILVCHIILAVHGALRRGYAVHLLCVEALPFDMRAQLWDAETAVAWEKAAAASHEPALVSLRQFASLQLPARSVSPFENLLLLSFR